MVILRPCLIACLTSSSHTKSVGWSIGALLAGGAGRAGAVVDTDEGGGTSAGRVAAAGVATGAGAGFPGAGAV